MEVGQRAFLLNALQSLVCDDSTDEKLFTAALKVSEIDQAFECITRDKPVADNRNAAAFE